MKNYEASRNIDGKTPMIIGIVNRSDLPWQLRSSIRKLYARDTEKIAAL